MMILEAVEARRWSSSREVPWTSTRSSCVGLSACLAAGGGAAGRERSGTGAGAFAGGVAGAGGVAWDQERPDELWIGHRNSPNQIVIKDPGLLKEGARSYAALEDTVPFGEHLGFAADGERLVLAGEHRTARWYFSPPPGRPFQPLAPGVWHHMALDAGDQLPQWRAYAAGGPIPFTQIFDH